MGFFKKKKEPPKNQVPQARPARTSASSQQPLQSKAIDEEKARMMAQTLSQFMKGDD